MNISSRLLLITNHQRKDGKFPVKVRICYLRETKDFKTPLYLTEDEYKNATVPNPTKKFREIKYQLDTLTAKMNEAINGIEHFTFQKFRDSFYGYSKSPSNIYAVFEEFIELKDIQGAYKTCVNYNTAMNSFKSFRPKLTFYDVDTQFLFKYHNWMKITQGRSETTISVYCRALRTIINYALSKNYIKKDFDYPFGKYKYQIPGGRNVKKALSIKAVELIYNYKAIPFSMEDRAKDFWILSYMCNGMNVNDIIRLKISNIESNMLRYHRGKTFRTTQANRPLISINLNEDILGILRKWGNIQQASNEYIFPFIGKEDTEKVIVAKKDLLTDSLNKYLKRVCENLKFSNSNITMIYARHTAATVLKKQDFSLSMISASLGHTNPKTTENYLADFDDEAKIEVTNGLMKFKNN